MRWQLLYKWTSINFSQVRIRYPTCCTALTCERSDSVMNRSAERVTDPGMRFVDDNDGDSPALLATTATVGAFPRWPATTMATRRDAQLIKAVRKLGWTHMGYRICREGAIRDRGTGASLSVYLVSGCFCRMVYTVLPRCLHPALCDHLFLFQNGQAWFWP